MNVGGFFMVDCCFCGLGTVLDPEECVCHLWLWDSYPVFVLKG